MITQAPLKLKITHLNYFGQGVSQIEGQTFYVPFTLPGELVEAQIVKKQRGVFECNLLNVLESSPKRVTPLCPYFGDCGGCELQHIKYSEQLQIKTSWVKKVFSVFNNILIHDCLASDSEYYYRNRITLHHNKKSFGYYKSTSHEIVNIKSCAIANPGINQKITLLDSQVFKNPSSFELREDNAKSFSQVNSSQNHNLIKTILSFCPQNKKQRILELYCGNGNFTFALAKVCQKITAIDGDMAAIEQAHIRKKELGGNNIQFMHSEVQSAVFDLSQSLQVFDVIVCDPPRDGLTVTAKLISRLKAFTIIYVSCNMFSFAQDVETLSSNGYKLCEIVPIDMFPQTRHVEIVGVFRL